MPTVTGAELIDRASKLLLDETQVRWKRAELLEHLNDGQRVLVNLTGSANSKNEVVQLVAGTRQEIPAAGLMILDVVRNMGTDGNTPGRAVRQVRMDTLNVTRLDWHSMSNAQSRVDHWMSDLRDPRHFYVDPPQPGNSPQQVEIIYSAAPTVLSQESDTIGVDDVYAPALLDYMVYRALSKETDAQQMDKAMVYYDTFTRNVTGRVDSRVRLQSRTSVRRSREDDE